MHFLMVFSCLFIFISCGKKGNTTGAYELPDMKTVSLTPVAYIEHDEVGESSGIAKSRAYPGYFWTHNDSGGKSCLYALKVEDGEMKKGPVLNLKNAENRDWEDLSIDRFGHIYVSDTGNNSQEREILHFYVIPEQSTNGLGKKYSFRYPDYKKPVKVDNFDCEALFHFNDKLYLLTKHRDDAKTKLYRFNELVENVVMVPEKLYTFDIGGQVTAADMSPSQKQLAVLTYDSIWLFKNFKDDRFFSGEVYFLPISARQCEAMCFSSEDELIITNEQRDIFKVAVHDFVLLSKEKKVYSLVK